MRHRGRALLPRREEFFCLKHFGALHMTDFDCDILNAACNYPKRGKEHRVTIARDYLG